MYNSHCPRRVSHMKWPFISGKMANSFAAAPTVCRRFGNAFIILLRCLCLHFKDIIVSSLSLLFIHHIFLSFHTLVWILALRTAPSFS